MGTFSLSSLLTYLAIQMALEYLVLSKTLLSEIGPSGQPTAILTSFALPLSFCKHSYPAAGGGGTLVRSSLELMIFSE